MTTRESPPATNDIEADRGGPPTLQIDGALATVTLRRPRLANRLEQQDLAALREHLAAVNAAPVLVLQVRSTGRHFCSGYDIGSIGAGAGGVRFDEVIDALEDCRPVTIAAIQGGVYGGATDLALACDFRIGGRRAEMFMPAARLGLHFYGRGLQRFVGRLGVDTAKRLFLTAETLQAPAMKDCGFLTELVDDDLLDARVDQLSQTVAALAPLAVTGMKKHLNRIARGALDIAELEEDVRRSLASDDLREGGRAWREKRAPRFTGR